MADAATRPERALFPPQRHERILSLVHERGRVDVAHLADEFDVTTETIRRDLSDLQRRRLVRRVHGGAVLWDSGDFQPLLAQRDVQFVDEKRRIAAAAIRELPPEGTLLLDSGSTTTRVLKQLPPECALTLVTNSVVAPQILSEHADVHLILLGGTVDKKANAVVDEQTVAAVRDLRVDVLILGTDGISPDGGLTTPYRNQAELKRAMIASAQRVIVVADHTKIGRDHFIRFASCADVDTLITDTAVEDDLTGALEATGLTVTRV